MKFTKIALALMVMLITATSVAIAQVNLATANGASFIEAGDGELGQGLQCGGGGHGRHGHRH